MAMARAKGSDRQVSDPQVSDSSSGTKASESPEMGYEQARAALADVVAALESGDATLEEALALWQQGEEYARVCESWLAGAQERLSQEEPINQEESINPEESTSEPK